MNRIILVGVCLLGAGALVLLGRAARVGTAGSAARAVHAAADASPSTPRGHGYAANGRLPALDDGEQPSYHPPPASTASGGEATNAPAQSIGGVPLALLGTDNPFSAIHATEAEVDALLTAFERVADRLYELDTEEMNGDLTPEQHTQAVVELMRSFEPEAIRILGLERRDAFMRATAQWWSRLEAEPEGMEGLIRRLADNASPDARIVRIANKLRHRAPTSEVGTE